MRDISLAPRSPPRYGLYPLFKHGVISGAFKIPRAHSYDMSRGATDLRRLVQIVQTCYKELKAPLSDSTLELS